MLSQLLRLFYAKTRTMYGELIWLTEAYLSTCLAAGFEDVVGNMAALRQQQYMANGSLHSKRVASSAVLPPIKARRTGHRHKTCRGGYKGITTGPNTNTACPGYLRLP